MALFQSVPIMNKKFVPKFLSIGQCLWVALEL